MPFRIHGHKIIENIRKNKEDIGMFICKIK